MVQCNHRDRTVQSLTVLYICRTVQLTGCINIQGQNIVITDCIDVQGKTAKLIAFIYRGRAV